MLNWHGYKMLDIAITLRISNYGGKTPSENRHQKTGNFWKITMKFGGSSTEIVADANKNKKINR
jgi:hypothetical protein